MFCLTANILTGFYLGVSLCFGGGLKYISDNLKYFKPSVIVAVPLIVDSIYKRIRIEAKKGGRERKLKRAIYMSNILRKIKIDIRKILFKEVLNYFGGDLNVIVCGGAFLEPDLVTKYDEFGISLRNGYGITECSPVIACNVKKRIKIDSVGLIAPSPYCDIKIIDGEICIKGSIVMDGYYNDQTSTKEVFVNGYFKTGDTGYIDEDNYLYITGRKKNLIILSDGNNISPEELENHLEKIPLVKSVIVCAKKQASNTIIVAQIFPDYDYIAETDCIDVEKGLNEEIKKVNDGLPPHKKIQRMEIVETDFQKTALGKVKRYLHI
jgi:long-chain acyl-CoA synthetase